jgi:hypothetical protein
MATTTEAPIGDSEVGGTREIAVLPDGPRSEMDPWIVLGADTWPGANAPAATPSIQQVIAAWRAADRELALLVEGDLEWNRICAELIGLRALHHRLFEARMAQDPTGGESSTRWSLAIMAWGPEPLPGRVLA